MKAAAGFLAALLCAASAAAQDAAPEALRQRLDRYETLYAETKNHSVLWLMAETYAQLGERQKALDAMEKVAELRMGFIPVGDSQLRKFAGDPRYEALVRRMQAELPTARRARTAFTVADPTLAPEGIAYDARSRRLFLGDARNRRIIQVDAAGKATPFARNVELPLLGMDVEPKSNRLWAATTNAFWDFPDKRAALVAFDLHSGRVARTVPAPEAQSLNDLDFAPNGDLWVTDSLGGTVFRLKAGADKLERMAPAGSMAYPNGVAVTDDARHVFVAQGASLRRIDAATGEILPLPQPDRLTTLGIDGLYWMGGSLVAVQNGGTAGRVLRMTLSPARDAITGFELLEAGHPAFDVPTTGAPAGDRLYVLANAQFSRARVDPKQEQTGVVPFVILETPL